jgi:hypothetical protein
MTVDQIRAFVVQTSASGVLIHCNSSGTHVATSSASTETFLKSEREMPRRTLVLVILGWPAA